jgi:hypothetical protein
MTGLQWICSIMALLMLISSLGNAVQDKPWSAILLPLGIGFFWLVLIELLPGKSS